MIDRRKKNYFEKLFFNPKFLSLLGLAAIILISLPFAKNAIKQYQINQEINGLKKQISALQNKNSDLKNFVSYLSSDQFAEEQARLNLGLKKPGEELTVIKSGLSGTAPTSTTASSIFNITGYDKTTDKPKLTNPSKWLRYFFK